MEDALPVKDICDIISAYMEPPNIISKLKQRMVRARNVLEQGLLPVKDICDIILAFLAPELVCKLTIHNTAWVNDLCVMPSGQFVAGGHGDLVAGRQSGRAALFTASKSKFACLSELFHPTAVTALVAFPDGRLASGCTDASVRVWDEGRCVLTLEGHTRRITDLVVLPGGLLASSSWDHTVRVWLGVRVLTFVGHAKEVTSLAVMPDGMLASASRDGTVRVWDSATGARLSVIWIGGWVSAVSVLPNGNLVTASTDGKLRVWSPDGAPLLAFEAHCDSLTSLAVCHGCLLSSNFDAYLHGWDTLTGERLFQIELPSRRITAFAVLPNGELVTSSSEKQICVWE